MNDIALCLHGQIRDFDKCLPAWKKFIDKYNPDIFYHTWDDMLTISSIKFSGFSITKSFDIQKYCAPSIIEYSSSARNVFPQMWSIKESVLQACSFDQIKKYKWLVRSRFDLSLHNPESINFNEFRNGFFVASNHWQGHAEMFDDNLMVGNFIHNACVSHDLFNYLNLFVNKNKKIPSGEQLLSDYVHTKRLLVIKHSSLDFSLGRNL